MEGVCEIMTVMEIAQMASELHVDAIKHSGGTSAITINSSGNVNIPGSIIQVVQATTATMEAHIVLLHIQTLDLLLILHQSLIPLKY